MTHRQAVILAGGLGTRLKPYTEKIPKPLLEVHGRPFLQWQLEYLRDEGFTHALLLIAYLGEQIQNYFDQNPVRGLTLSYHREDQPLGTGGALKNAEAQLPERFFLFNGDTFLKTPFSQLEKMASPYVMVVYDQPQKVGVTPNVLVTSGRAVAYSSPQANMVDAGVYLLSKKIVRDHALGVFPLKELLASPMAQGQVAAFLSAEAFYDMGTLERLHNAPQDLFRARR